MTAETEDAPIVTPDPETNPDPTPIRRPDGDPDVKVPDDGGSAETGPEPTPAVEDDDGGA